MLGRYTCENYRYLICTNITNDDCLKRTRSYLVNEEKRTLLIPYKI